VHRHKKVFDMPIYAYRCEACGHAKDVLQKMSDPQLHICPACNADAFRKQVTAAGFQLKGSGWYATDFKNNNAPKSTSAEPEGSKPNDSNSGDVAPSTSDTAKPADTAAVTAPSSAQSPAATKPATSSSSSE
jgi:putative FmdB family regulatory protein